ncbi:MAG: DNA repair protein RadC [Candidatus Dormibacteraeota bacterium]|nr:DNA repair protein RadC [Candidatus Dormibacteraeota bacterium]MBV8445461.1 DNA repair protein RadC [Candidatus Dormibacteraeota bacterium]
MALTPCTAPAAAAIRPAVNASALSDGELIARILGGAEPSVELRAVSARLARIPAAQRAVLGVHDLAREHGVTPERAARLAAVWELAGRWQPDERPAITAPRDAVLLLEPLRNARREEIWVLLLDARHRCVALETVAVGTLNASRLAPRDVFSPALQRDAVAVILGHNHPSGDPSPSRADRVVTAAVRSAGEMLGIALLDHVIVTRHSHHSFRENEGWP